MGQNDKIKMHINIAGEHIELSVDFSQQNDVRATEASVGKLFEKWRKQFPRKTDRELLAMISYQYASYYLLMCRKYEEAVARIERFERSIDDLLQDE